MTSNDDAKSWSGARFVIDPPGIVRAFDPVVWVDPQGRLWWFYAQSHGITTWDGRAGVWAITTDEPDRPHPIWSAPRRICDGIMMNKPTVLRKGDWLLPVAIWNRAPSTATGVTEETRKYVHWDPSCAGAHVYRSQDKGATFELWGSVKIADAEPSEHMIIERRDESLWMLVRATAGILECTSIDGGRTWSEARLSPIPHVASRFFIRRLDSGSLLLVKNNPRMDTVGLPGLSELYTGRRRSHLTAYLSDDDGRTWRGGLLLDERPGVSYPDGDESPDGTIYLISDYDRYREKEIVLARFTEKDVIAARLITMNATTRILINKGTGPDAR